MSQINYKFVTDIPFMSIIIKTVNLNEKKNIVNRFVVSKPVVG